MTSTEILIPITLFLTSFGITYVIFITRHKERMSLIEKGADPSIFRSRQDGRFTSMRIGMFLVGIALGILAGNIIAETTKLKAEVAYFSMIFLFGGLSLISYYLYVDKKIRKADKPNDSSNEM